MAGLHPVLQAVKRNLPSVARSYGFEARVTSGYRSYAKQKKLYESWLAGTNPYPAAPPGTSDHERGLALDVVSTNTMALVSLLREVGLNWAGSIDPIHFSLETPAISRRTQKVQQPQPSTSMSDYQTAWDYYKAVEAPKTFELSFQTIRNWLGF